MAACQRKALFCRLNVQMVRIVPMRVQFAKNDIEPDLSMAGNPPVSDLDIPEDLRLINCQ